MTSLRTASGLRSILVAAVICAVSVSAGSADVFTAGTTQFTIDFVPISRESNPSSGYGIVNYNYRISEYAVSNAQMNAVASALGLTFANATNWTGDDLPTNRRTWFEAAHFVNWLNTSQGHQAAYKFEGTAFKLWSPEEAWGGTNLYRHKDAFYFLPTEDEWVKAAYWNGTTLQTYATPDNSVPVYGVDSIFGQGTPYAGPWDVGSGTVELNGTYNMMGNLYEWMESPFNAGEYSEHMGYTDLSSRRAVRGGSYENTLAAMDSTSRDGNYPVLAGLSRGGFRVASVPEPGGMAMLLAAVVGLLMRRRHRGD